MQTSGTPQGRLAHAMVGGEPEVAGRPGGLGQRGERLTADLGEVNRGPAGQPVGGC